MIVEFLRCFYCGKVTELGKLMEEGFCACGSKKVVKTNVTDAEFIWYTCFRHPSFLLRAIKEWWHDNG